MHWRRPCKLDDRCTWKFSMVYFWIGHIPNFSKKHILGVKEELISSLGAVSLEVVREMAIKGLQKTGSDYVISISGIAGPSGGSPEKPVGTVCIAWGNADMIESKIFFFSGDRQKVRLQTIETSLKEMLKYLKL